MSGPIENKVATIAPAISSLQNGTNIPIPQVSTMQIKNEATSQDIDMTPKAKKKKKVSKACVYCRRSHMICDDSRPCQRCLKRNIGHLCHDEPPTTRQRKNASSKNGKPTNSSESTSPVAGTPGAEIPIPPGLSQQAQASKISRSASQQLMPNPATPNPVGPRTGNNNSNGFVANDLFPQSHSSLYLNQQPVFFSEHAGSEFSSLNEFLQMIDDPEFLNTMNNDPILQNIDNSISNNGSTQNLNFLDSSMPAQTPPFNAQQQDTNLVRLPNNNGKVSGTALPQLQSSSSLAKFSSVPAQQQAPTATQPQPPQQQQQPLVTDNARDKFFLTAADPTTEISPEERLKQVINAKLEAGLLKPYNYAEGYARLQRYMDSHMNPSSRQRILKPLSVFRPAFRAIAKTLKDIDLILVEESFERMLLDYDRVFTSMAIPACLWRRTGEIYRGNKEFASLVEVNIDDLKNGKLTIYELMSEESSVNFWEKYGSIAFDKTQKAVLTSCKLKTKDGRKKKNCCFSFTIRRDRYNIPSCIVGNFIPISE